VEQMAGDAGSATEELFATTRTLEDLGETEVLVTLAGMLADTLVDLGRDVEAERFSRRSEELADPDDFDAQMRWRRARARVLARRGELEAAERLAREALELVAGTDALNDHADTLLDLAEVLRLAGRGQQAARAVGEAIVLYERKENVAMATQARRLL
jgi:ATP/maltotriose-dependent transcriptional regulator MalT